MMLQISSNCRIDPSRIESVSVVSHPRNAEKDWFHVLVVMQSGAHHSAVFKEKEPADSHADYIEQQWYIAQDKHR